MLTLILASFFAFLAQWQFGRAQDRARVSSGPSSTEIVRPLTEAATPQQMLPGEDAYQMVDLTGHYNPGQQVVVPARKLDGKDGFWVVTMFAVDGAQQGGATGSSDSSGGAMTGTAAREVAIPVVRGWVADRGAAEASRVGADPVRMTARLTPTEAPSSTLGLPKGEVATVSTAQLVNFWDVASYPAFLLPTEQSGAGAQAATAGLRSVPAPPPKPGGINLQSLFYGIEWVVFAFFALYIWWRMVRDEYLREIEEAQMADNEDLIAFSGAEKAGAEKKRIPDVEIKK